MEARQAHRRARAQKEADGDWDTVLKRSALAHPEDGRHGVDGALLDQQGQASGGVLLQGQGYLLRLHVEPHSMKAAVPPGVDHRCAGQREARPRGEGARTASCILLPWFADVAKALL